MWISYSLYSHTFVILNGAPDKHFIVGDPVKDLVDWQINDALFWIKHHFSEFSAGFSSFFCFQRFIHLWMRFIRYYVYIVTNSQKNVLYIGVTNDLSQRIIEHFLQRGHPSSFCGRYYCYWLVYFEEFTYVNHAISREKELKGFTRTKKENLIASENPAWIFLNKHICNDGWPPKDGKARWMPIPQDPSLGLLR